jgi:hypothetical protein
VGTMVEHAELREEAIATIGGDALLLVFLTFTNKSASVRIPL